MSMKKQCFFSIEPISIECQVYTTICHLLLYSFCMCLWIEKKEKKFISSSYKIFDLLCKKKTRERAKCLKMKKIEIDINKCMAICFHFFPLSLPLLLFIFYRIAFFSSSPSSFVPYFFHSFFLPLRALPRLFIRILSLTTSLMKH